MAYRKISALVLFLALAACHNAPVWKHDMFKYPVGGPNGYSELYIQGWRDGCESGADASADHFYKIRYEFKQDWQLIGNVEYRMGWDTAYNQCRKYVLQQNMNKYRNNKPEKLDGWHMSWQGISNNRFPW